MIPSLQDRTQQENAILILYAQLDAQRLVRLAAAAEQQGGTVVTIAIDDAKAIAERMTEVAGIAERAHLGLYGFLGQQRAKATNATNGVTSRG